MFVSLQVKCHIILYAILGVQILEIMVICISKLETIFVVSYLIRTSCQNEQGKFPSTLTLYCLLF